MPMHKAWVLRCADCTDSATFFSSDCPMDKHQATRFAHEQGWREVYGDWRCPGCVPRVKRAHRLARRASATHSASHSATHSALADTGEEASA